MNKKLLIFCFWILANLPLYAQVDSMQIRVAGIIHSSNEKENTPFVFVINKHTGYGVLSDSLGIFKINIKKQDTLLFRCIGFEDYVMTLPDTMASTICFLEISLSPATYQLNVVNIYALSRENQFRYDFIHLKPDKYSWERQLIIPGVTRDKYQWVREDEKFNPKQTFDGPISALYYAFSDEGKSLRKLAELMEEDEMELLIDEKYNKNQLSDFSGFEGAKLDAFFKYLGFTNSYLYSATAYDIFLEVQKRMPDFESNYQEGEKK
jgi:hypothetical protein